MGIVHGKLHLRNMLAIASLDGSTCMELHMAAGSLSYALPVPCL